MINNVDLEMMLSEVVRRTDNKFPGKRKKKKFDRKTAERVVAELRNEQHSEIMIYHAFLWSNLHSRVKDSDSTYNAMQKLEARFPDKSFVIRYLIYDVLEWIKDPLSIVDHRKVYRKNPLLEKAHNIPVDFGNIENEYGITLNKNSALMGISIDELIHLCSYKFNLVYELSDLYRMKRLADILVTNSKKRKMPLFNEAAAFIEILTRPYEKDIIISRHEESRAINYDDAFNVDSLKNITVYHLQKQTTPGKQGFSYFAERIIEQFKSCLDSPDNTLENFERLQVTEVKNIINSNSKEFRNLILQGENQFLNYLAMNAYRQEFGNTDIFEDKNYLVKDLALRILLHHSPLEKTRTAQKLSADSFKFRHQTNTEYVDSDILDYLCETLPPDNVFAKGKKLMRFIKEITGTRYDGKKIATNGYVISAVRSPVKAFFDAMGNFCLSGGSKFKTLYDISSRPMPLRDFGLDYVLNKDIFHILGLSEINGKSYSPILAKANVVSSEKITRLGTKEIRENVLIVDDVPGLDSLNHIFPGWIENMYHAVMNYAAMLNKKGANLTSVLFNIRHSEAQKSVKEFTDYVRTRAEAYEPMQKGFELISEGRMIERFNYNFEVRTKRVSQELMQKLRQEGYSHYMGQHCIDATYSWYEFIERNINFIPLRSEDLYGPFSETREEILGLIESNDALFKHKTPRPAYNFGNGLINAIEVSIAGYTGNLENVQNTVFDVSLSEHAVL